MKKTFSILLCAALFLCAASALAEQAPFVIEMNEKLSVSFIVPENYEISENRYGDIFYATFTPLNGTDVGVVLSVGASEEYLSRSIGDLTDEELQNLIDVATGDFADPSVTVTETSHGTKLIVLDENSEYDEYAEIFTVYQGYFITALVQRDPETQLTEAELQLAVDVLSQMEFVTAE